MKDTKRNEGIRKETKGYERVRKETIDLLLFAGIEPTGTMFQTINNKHHLKRKK